MTFTDVNVKARDPVGSKKDYIKCLTDKPRMTKTDQKRTKQLSQ